MGEKPKKRRGPLLWLGGRSRRFCSVATSMMMPVLYAASYGPACWLNHFGLIPDGAGLRTLVYIIYSPLDWLVMNAPKPISDSLASYASALFY